MRTAAILVLSLFFLVFGSSGIEIDERKDIHFRADHASASLLSGDDVPLGAVLSGILQRRVPRTKTPNKIAAGIGTAVAPLSRPDSGNRDPLFPHITQQDLFQRLGVYRL